MKWRPISKLSDEQRDGRWWTFGMDVYTKVKQFEGPRFSGKDLEQYRYCKEKECWMDYNGSDIDSEYICETHFLSEPLPDFPKPMKMQWRKFKEEAPYENQLILVSESVGQKPFVVIFCDGLTNYKTHWHWMPILPPEDE